MTLADLLKSAHIAVLEGVWSNGAQISFYHRKDPNYFEDIPAIPSAHEKHSDILCELQ